MNNSVIPGNTRTIPFEDGLVVVRFPYPCLFLLNATARYVWDCFSDGQNVEQAALALSVACEIPLEITRRDVAAAVALWHQQGLLGPLLTNHPEIKFISKRSPESSTVGTAILPPTGIRRDYRFMGKSISLFYEDSDLENAVHPRFDGLASAQEGASSVSIEIFREGPECIISQHGREPIHCASPPDAGYRLFYEITGVGHDGLELAAWLHGGVMSRAGATVLLIGHERSGKSTMNAALLHVGFECYGDDRILLERGSMRPAASPNAIGLKRGSWPVLRERFPQLDSLPICPIAQQEVRFLPAPPVAHKLAPPVRAVLFPKYHPAAQSELQRLAPVEALQRMIEAYAWVSSEIGDVEKFLHWVQSVPCYALPFSCLDRAVELVCQLENA